MPGCVAVQNGTKLILFIELAGWKRLPKIIKYIKWIVKRINLHSSSFPGLSISKASLAKPRNKQHRRYSFLSRVKSMKSRPMSLLPNHPHILSLWCRSNKLSTPTNFVYIFAQALMHIRPCVYQTWLPWRTRLFSIRAHPLKSGKWLAT